MNKNFLLVGGNSTIAKSLMLKLKENKDTPLAVSRERGEVFEDVAFYQGDVTDYNNQLPEIPVELDGIVYFPGTLNLKPFAQIDMQTFKSDMEVNFFGAVRTVQHYHSQLKKNTPTSIVLISSVAATLGLPFHTSISSCKSALEGFAKALASELAPHVRVNVIAPTLTETALSKKLLQTEEKKELFSKRHPSGRIAQPEDVVNMINYLLSDESSMINGATIPIDGGYSKLRI